MTSPINFGGGVGTQPVIQNPGMAEALAPLLEALQRQQLSQQNAEKLALETQIREAQLAEAQAAIDARERKQANDEAMGSVLQQLIAEPEDQQVDLPSAAGVGTATVPVQSPSLGELAQDLPPEIVAETIQRGQPIQDARDQKKADQLAGRRLRDRRIAAVENSTTQIGRDLLIRKYELDAAGVDPATQRLIMQAEMGAADQSRIDQIRRLPVVVEAGWNLFPDAEMVELYLDWKKGNAQRADQYGRAGQGGVAERENETEAFNKYVADREKHVRSADPVLLSDYDEYLRGANFDARQRMYRLEWADLQRNDKAEFRWLAEQGMNRKLVTPPDQRVGDGIGDEELAMMAAGVIATARRGGALVGEGQIGRIRPGDTEVTPGDRIGLSPGTDAGGLDLPRTPDPMELVEGIIRNRFAKLGLDLEDQRFQRIMMRGYWLSRSVDSHIDVIPEPPENATGTHLLPGR